MNFENQTTSLALVYLILLCQIQAKHVFPGFTVFSSVDDMEVAAAQPRPVVIPSMIEPRVLPLVADSSELGDTEVSASSEVMQKTLRHPSAFSYNDQVQEATIQEINPSETSLVTDYFKYLKNVEEANSQEGGGKVDSSEAISDEKESGEDDLIHSKIKNDSEEEDNLKTVESRNDNSHEAYEVNEKKEHGKGGSHGGHEHDSNGGDSDSGKEGDSKPEASDKHSGDGGEFSYKKRFHEVNLVSDF